MSGDGTGGAYVPLSHPTWEAFATWEEDPWQAMACDGKKVLCVDQAATAAERGTSEEPYHSIAAAIAAAETGTTIQVAAGTYKENLAVKRKKVSLYGGFPGKGNFSDRDRRAHLTTIDAGGSGTVFDIYNAPGTRIDGFKITRGSGKCGKYSCEGGGLYIRSSGPEPVTIAYCEITENSVQHEGGGNDARGGGINTEGVVTVLRNYIHHNRAQRGAGVHGSGVTLTENRIVQNVGHGNHGGGLNLYGDGLQLTRNFISKNETGRALGYGWGGGVIAFGKGTNIVTEGNLITQNFAPTGGAGIFIDDEAMAVMRNDLIVGNTSIEGNPGLRVGAKDDNGTPSIVHLYNVTIANNRCARGTQSGNAVWVSGKDSAAHLHSCILWDNDGPSLRVLTGAIVTAEYTLSQDPIKGEGNLSADPLFVAPRKGDFHLKSTAGHHQRDGVFAKDTVLSPAIDAGDPEADFAAESGPNGGRVNLGAYGNSAAASRSPK